MIFNMVLRKRNIGIAEEAAHNMLQMTGYNTKSIVVIITIIMIIIIIIVIVVVTVSICIEI